MIEDKRVDIQLVSYPAHASCSFFRTLREPTCFKRESCYPQKYLHTMHCERKQGELSLSNPFKHQFPHLQNGDKFVLHSCWELYLCPIAAITNYYKLSGLKQHKLIMYSSGSQSPKWVSRVVFFLESLEG